MGNICLLENAMFLSTQTSFAITHQQICGNIQKYFKIKWILTTYRCSQMEARAALPKPTLPDIHTQMA